MYIKHEGNLFLVKYGNGDNRSYKDEVVCAADRLETAVDLLRVFRGEEIKDDYYVRKAIREYDRRFIRHEEKDGEQEESA